MFLRCACICVFVARVLTHALSRRLGIAAAVGPPRCHARSPLLKFTQLSDSAAWKRRSACRAAHAVTAQCMSGGARCHSACVFSRRDPVLSPLLCLGDVFSSHQKTESDKSDIFGHPRCAEAACEHPQSRGPARRTLPRVLPAGGLLKPSQHKLKWKRPHTMNYFQDSEIFYLQIHGARIVMLLHRIPPASLYDRSRDLTRTGLN